MNIFKHFSVITTALTLFSLCNISAVRHIKKTARKQKFEEIFQQFDTTFQKTQQFLETVTHIAQSETQDSQKRMFVIQNSTSMSIETLEKALSILDNKKNNTWTFIKNKIEEKKRSLETNKRKRDVSPLNENKKRKHNNKEKKGCPICLKNTATKKLPTTTLFCGHVLHTKCLISGLKKNKTNTYICPFCKKNYKAKDILTYLKIYQGLSSKDFIIIKNCIKKNKIKLQIKNWENKGALNFTKHLILFSDEEINDIIKTTLKNNNFNAIAIFLKNKTCTQNINFYESFFTAAQYGNIESLQELLNPSLLTEDTFYTETLKIILDFLEKNKNNMSIQTITETLFADDLNIPEIKEYYYYVCFIIILASDKIENNISQILEKTLQEDPTIFTKIAQSHNAFCTVTSLERTLSIFRCVTNLDTSDILNIFFTQKTINGLGDLAQIVINDIFKNSLDINALDSMDAIINNPIASQLSQETIYNVFMDALKLDNYQAVENFMNNETMTKRLLTTDAWEIGFTSAFLKQDKDMIESLLISSCIPKNTITRMLAYINQQQQENEFTMQIKDLLQNYKK